MHEFLKEVPFFADLPEDDVKLLSDAAQDVHLPAGNVLFEEGTDGDKAYVIKAGQLEVLKQSGGRAVLLAVREPGEMIGEMALLEEAVRMATVRARTDCVLVAISKEQLDHLLSTSVSAASAMFYGMLGRWRSTEAMLRQSEKMAQLGTMTAGVAHELNNPAAAVKRGVDQLQEMLKAFVESQSRIDGLAPDGPHRQTLAELAALVQESAGRPTDLDPIARSDREMEIEEWLEEHGLEEGWELAPALVSLGYDETGLGGLADRLGSELLPTALRWMSSSYAVQSLLAEIGQGAGRISDIVKAMKSYSYLDQAPVQNVDVHEGLDNTLLILRSKLSGTHVRREYATDLPKIQGYGSELNQVWTNLLDNAADALEGQGEIAIRTHQEGDEVVVEIEDNGPGIPTEIQSRVFDPFFTTKPPGQGTGLGLDISYNIVVQKHSGYVKLFSEPGRTRFEVRLPMDFDQRTEGR